jgi:hypothetical protein
MLKNVLRFAALALTLAMVGNAAQFEWPMPTCSTCDGGNSGN